MYPRGGEDQHGRCTGRSPRRQVVLVYVVIASLGARLWLSAVAQW